MKLLLEISLIFAVCLAGQGLAALLPFPFPSSVMAMVLLFLLLLIKLIKPRQIENFSGFLLKNMALLFIPSGVGILESLDALRGSILPLLVICLVTTVLTFAVTACTVHGVILLQEAVCRRAEENKCGMSKGLAGKEDILHD
ncbi:CidA/LrgA family protein [Marasmitruncus massiliensis]|uniref:CidA/LrgA family protein n=1 Tax=Marasmitruncus massiliensis TaxID=1944642 RepID=UPI000C7E3BCB|nr:CidA/LrgA family protein [Marasmitruncus massiliensis]